VPGLAWIPFTNLIYFKFLLFIDFTLCFWTLSHKNSYLAIIFIPGSDLRSRFYAFLILCMKKNVWESRVEKFFLQKEKEKRICFNFFFSKLDQYFKFRSSMDDEYLSTFFGHKISANKEDVNFTNILRAAFLNKSVLHSFSLITAWLIFWWNNICNKAAHKMLVKLTIGLAFYMISTILEAIQIIRNTRLAIF